eukprot:6065738-Pleurochrysis_carterae.AAC.2
MCTNAETSLQMLRVIAQRVINDMSSLQENSGPAVASCRVLSRASSPQGSPASSRSGAKSISCSISKARCSTNFRVYNKAESLFRKHLLRREACSSVVSKEKGERRCEKADIY